MGVGKCYLTTSNMSRCEDNSRNRKDNPQDVSKREGVSGGEWMGIG